MVLNRVPMIEETGVDTFKVWNLVSSDVTPNSKGCPTKGREIYCGTPMCHPEYEQPSWAINKCHYVMMIKKPSSSHGVQHLAGYIHLFLPSTKLLT